ncbi:hypothetical protein SAMN05216207_101840 [Pseudonocardia ammonioxydans]|uniref:Major Facilitator Superfamily protein n=1 Tax=Pseudonocardia ammonioxydans TaxID=260086 RepID=A0A1I5ALS6_PSUAM|nr:hypothetical protein [Pseudonocardia ammonioxydans]SFN63300.1 hypothetical protein SAMN05216207_101840 [Pseudonocardia ammonioxydans]
MLVRLLLLRQALHHAVPLFSLYALLFDAAGLDLARISALFVLWSVAGLVLEVPSGMLADRWSRRGALVADGLLTGAGFAVWLLAPGFAGFATGFVLWSGGGALASGALEALTYDGLAAHGAAAAYPRVLAALETTAQLAQVPAALAATLLLTAPDGAPGPGTYAVAGWVSVAVCGASAAVSLAVPHRFGPAGPGSDSRAGAGGSAGHSGGGSAGRSAGGGADRSGGGGRTDSADGPAGTRDDGVLAGLRLAWRTRGLRVPLLAVAAVGGIDAAEEYFPLQAAASGVPVELVPVALLAVPLAGAAGSAAGGWLAGRPALAVPAMLGSAAGLALSGVATPVGPLALLGCWGLFQAVKVVTGARLQDAITGPARATVTSVAGLGTELVGIAVFGIWALGGPVAAAGLCAAAALLLVPYRAAARR